MGKSEDGGRAEWQLENGTYTGLPKSCLVRSRRPHAEARAAVQRKPTRSSAHQGVADLALVFFRPRLLARAGREDAGPTSHALSLRLALGGHQRLDAHRPKDLGHAD